MIDDDKTSLGLESDLDVEPRGRTGDDSEYSPFEKLRFKVRELIDYTRWRLRRELRWQLDKRTDLLDRKDSGQFIKDLKGFKERFKIDETKHVLYVGCGHDLTVKRELPQAIYLDADKVRRTRGVRYVQADARSIPMDDSSMDALIVRAIDYNLLTEPETLSEFRRVLEDNGVILLSLGSGNKFAENIQVQIINNLNSHGFSEEARLSEDAVVFRLKKKDELALGN